MSQVKIKVIGLVNVDEKTAKQIDSMLGNSETKKENPYIRTKKWSGYLSEITGVLHDPDPVLDNKQSSKQEDEYKQFRKNFLSKSAEDKGKNTKMFNLYYCAVLDNFEPEFKPSEEIVEKVIQIQTVYFFENPYRCFCDPSLWKGLLISPMHKKISIWSKFVFTMIENQVNVDARYAKYKN